MSDDLTNSYEHEKLAVRLANTERALCTVLIKLQPPEAQEVMDNILKQYFDANTKLGFDANPNFVGSISEDF
ncbi:MAG: hypothetical protein IPK73_30455 [Candidatus Obscuribacter sp.]|nr:hypothetical protein [Candidatus Obscuribacter sp.]